MIRHVGVNMRLEQLLLRRSVRKVAISRDSSLVAVEIDLHEAMREVLIRVICNVRTIEHQAHRRAGHVG